MVIKQSIKPDKVLITVGSNFGEDAVEWREKSW